MTSTKRSWDEVEDSDEDEPLMGKQTLPVANLPANFDGIPKDGMQYLFMVRHVRLSQRVHSEAHFSYSDDLGGMLVSYLT